MFYQFIDETRVRCAFGKKQLVHLSVLFFIVLFSAGQVAAFDYSLNNFSDQSKAVVSQELDLVIPFETFTVSLPTAKAGFSSCFPSFKPKSVALPSAISSWNQRAADSNTGLGLVLGVEIKLSASKTAKATSLSLRQPYHINDQSFTRSESLFQGCSSQSFVTIR